VPYEYPPQYWRLIVQHVLCIGSTADVVQSATRACG
jgi:hypothetical protein